MEKVTEEQENNPNPFKFKPRMELEESILNHMHFIAVHENNLKLMQAYELLLRSFPSSYSEFDVFNLTVESSEKIDFTRYAEYLELRAKLLAIQGSDPVTEQLIETWQERRENAMVQVEKDSVEANANFEQLWDECTEIAKRSPVSMIAFIIQNYPQERQVTPSEFSQELKNQHYLKLKEEFKKANKREFIPNIKTEN